jgi:peptidoglycan/xylan/chitin deacetylase (PgdA/CDA1 family)
MSLRLDRLATLYVSNPIGKHLRPRRASIPILMYHSISDESQAGVSPYYQTTTTPKAFAEQMAYLSENGYATISPAEAAVELSDSAAASSKKVVVTFDDGFRDFYTDAFPLLERFGFRATVYLPTAYVGESRASFKGNPCLTWSEVRELQGRGIEFGSHTVTHPQLYDSKPEAIEEEVLRSRQTIERELGCVVDSFAYPYAFPEPDGAFKRRLRETLRQAGYRNGVCTTIGRPDATSDVFFMERLPVNSGDDLSLFRAKLEGAYDWLAKPQYLVKKAKRWANSANRG